MTTRRNFIQASLVMSALPVALGESRAEAAGRLPAPNVLVDRRFPESVSFGRHFAAKGGEVFGYEGDISSLWTGPSAGRWWDGSRPLVGLTASNVHFIFEQIGRDLDARTSVRAEHHPSAGEVRHVIYGRSGLPEELMLPSGPRWPSEMARLVAAYSHDAAAGAVKITRSPDNAFTLGHDEPFLVSWLITPVPRE